MLDGNRAMNKLTAALTAVDWNQNVQSLCKDVQSTERIHNCSLRLAAWSRQIEQIESGNQALSFVREMQRAGHNVACCIALGLYKPAAGAMRSLVECSLYYAYFRAHPVELATLVRDPRYYASKRDILAYFAKHVPDFSKRQCALNYVDRLEAWYSQTSAIVHGQIPGVWSNGVSIGDTAFNAELANDAVLQFEKAAMLVQDTFLCVLGLAFWAQVESDAKRFLSKGMSGNLKTALLLDSA